MKTAGPSTSGAEKHELSEAKFKEEMKTAGPSTSGAEKHELSEAKFKEEMKTATPSTSGGVKKIIHMAAAAAAAVGAGLAQVPGSDAPVLVSIQTTMIIAIAQEYGVPVTKAAAADLLLTFTATAVGRGISQWLVGWIPGLGNVINASTAAALTEAVGWAADAYFREQRAGT
jgi:uncharacterized protein (DUF697 family)